ncbi:MAG: haloacid dehalogenase-like hydrolase [Bacteroidota bacterium]|nr:haloacid dehalogenase-like hydrolase [Bacteroidota bacterium]
MHSNSRSKILNIWIIIFLFCSLSYAECLGAKNKHVESWAANSKALIDKMIEENSAAKGAYAVFDWDNTSIFGDVEETLFLYQLDNLLFRMTPEEFKYSFTHYADDKTLGNLEIPNDSFAKLYNDAEGHTVNISLIAKDCCDDFEFLYANSNRMNPKKGKMSIDEIKQSEQYLDFKAKMWFTYNAIYNSFNVNMAYSWILYVTAPGFTEKEYKKIIAKAIDNGMKSESKKLFFESPFALKGKGIKISNTCSGNYYKNAIRTTSEISGLFDKLMKNKIQVYICTASLQQVVETFATEKKYGYNLPLGHVLGMRLKKDANGKYLSQYDFSGNYMVNGFKGKSFNINNILVPKYNSNPVMVGGDSDGDYYMMTELSGLNAVKMINNYSPVQLVLVINRNKKGMIGQICSIAEDQMLSGKSSAPAKVVLQGRDETTGYWIPTEKTAAFQH